MEMAGKHSDHYFCRWQAKIVTTINFFFEKNEKCLEFSDLARRLIRKTFWKFVPLPTEFLGLKKTKKQKVLRILWFGEKVDQQNFLKILPPPDMCAEKFLIVSMGGRVEGLACADPVARTPIFCSQSGSPDLHQAWCQPAHSLLYFERVPKCSKFQKHFFEYKFLEES